jgi:hypothetical protein
MVFRLVPDEALMPQDEEGVITGDDTIFDLRTELASIAVDMMQTFSLIATIAAKPFSIVPYVNAYARYLELQHKAKKVHPKTGELIMPMGEQDRKRLTEKLMSMPPKERDMWLRLYFLSKPTIARK